MNPDDNIEEVEVKRYKAKCPECPREFGPDTKQRVRSQLTSHYYAQHS